MSRLTRVLALTACLVVVASLLLAVAGSRDSSPPRGAGSGSAAAMHLQPSSGPTDIRRASACSKFASPSGTDSGSGTRAKPFRTPQRLADALSPGQTGCLRAGTYESSGVYLVAFTHGGSAGAPISIESYPGERAHLVGIVEVPPGRSNIRIANLDIEGTGTMNTVTVYSDDVTIEGNDITNERRGTSCLLLGSLPEGPAVRTLVRRNVFHRCGTRSHGTLDHNIYAGNAAEARIVENVFYDSTGYAIQLYPQVTDTLVAHNVIDGTGAERGGIVIGGDGGHTSRGNTIERNVVTYGAVFNVGVVWEGPVGSANAVDDNCVWGAGDDNIEPGAPGLSTHGNLTADPGFVNRGQHDYRMAAGSACLALVGEDTAALLSAGPSRQDRGRPAILSARRGSGSRRRTVLVRARDKLSGVESLQLATNRRHPSRARRLAKRYRGRHVVRQRLHYGPSGRRLYVRAIDVSGNRSRWRHVSGT